MRIVTLPQVKDRVCRTKPTQLPTQSNDPVATIYTIGEEQWSPGLMTVYYTIDRAIRLSVVDFTDGEWEVVEDE